MLGTSWLLVMFKLLQDSWVHSAHIHPKGSALEQDLPNLPISDIVDAFLRASPRTPNPILSC